MRVGPSVARKVAVCILSGKVASLGGVGPAYGRHSLQSVSYHDICPAPYALHTALPKRWRIAAT
jgi:hypothetical protein